MKHKLVVLAALVLFLVSCGYPLRGGKGGRNQRGTHGAGCYHGKKTLCL